MLKYPNEAKDFMVEEIKKYFAENGPMCSAVIGLSGGKDSTIAAALCVEALGADRVVAVTMPRHKDTDADYNLALEIAQHLGVNCITMDIAQIYSGFYDAAALVDMAVTNQASINLSPRIRMAMLYFVAQCLPNGGRVICTENYSEGFVGYSTKFGDNVGDFAPLADLMVSEVKQIGFALGLPEHWVEKPPADGLSGLTDEDALGFTYKQLEDYICNGTCGGSEVDTQIRNRLAYNRHKFEAVNIPTVNLPAHFYYDPEDNDD